MDQLHDDYYQYDDDDAEHHRRDDGYKCFHDELLNHVHAHKHHHDDDQGGEEGVDDDDDEDHNYCLLLLEHFGKVMDVYDIEGMKEGNRLNINVRGDDIHKDHDINHDDALEEGRMDM